MDKSVSEPFPNIVNGVMTGTTVITSSVSSILRRDTVGIQLQWTSSPVGNFEIQVSNDYKPGLQQTEGYGVPTNGTWISLAIQNPVTGATATTISTSLGSPYAINLQQLGFTWIRVIYTNISGTGTLNSFISAKSLG